MEETKIKYKNLSIPLKIAIIGAWICGSIYFIAFLAGIIQGLLNV